jgi:Lar family restriction alleviation protein
MGAKVMAMTLEPCPFCGGQCEIVKGYAVEAVWPHREFHRVFCTSCQARQLFHRTPEEAAAAWNRRAHISQPAQAVDVDSLAQEIRRVDGSHSLGAAALAEALTPFITRAISGGKAGPVGEVMRKGFMTTESCGPDKRYVLSIKFQSLEDLQAAHSALAEASR